MGSETRGCFIPGHMKKLIKRPVSEPVSTKVSIGGRVERHLRMREAAQILGVSRPTLFRWLPRIRHLRIPAGGLTKEIVLIPESALAEFLTAHERLPNRPTEAV